MTIQIATPQWIERVFPPRPGRDHLGLGSVTSDQILPKLSPGINVLTRHPRYHSFYVFLLDEFWRRDRAKTAASWRAFFRPREFIYSLGAHLPEHASRFSSHENIAGIVGANRTGPLAAEAHDSYDTDEDYIEASLGGYGLYYRSVMAELGIIYPGGRGYATPIDVPSERGKALAETFRKAIAQTEYYRAYFESDQTSITREVIEEYANCACLCRLAVQAAPDRGPLREAFLHGGTESQAASRRSTFRFLLDLAKQTQGFSVTETVFRQLAYFHESEDGARFKPHITTTDVAASWRLYQAREYYNLALNRIWRAVCAFGYEQSGETRPIAKGTLTAFATSGASLDAVAERHGVNGSAIDAQTPLPNVLQWLTEHLGAASKPLVSAFSIRTPLNEYSLLRANGSAGRDDATYELSAMLVLLLMLFLRFEQVPLEPNTPGALLRMGSDGRLPMAGREDSFFEVVRRHRDRRAPIGDLVRWLVDDHIVLQHQLVASQKLPDDTYRFREEAGSLRFFRFDNSVGQRDSRFDALSTTLAELGLVRSLHHNDHPLTQDGERLLANGDLS